MLIFCIMYSNTTPPSGHRKEKQNHIQPYNKGLHSMDVNNRYGPLTN